MRNKKAFTLAEILLTLTVIGVVACLCIPALIEKVQYEMYVSALKKDIANLSSAFKLIQSDNADSVVGIFTSSNTIMNLFCNKLNCALTCQANQQPGVCFEDGQNSWHTLDGRSGWQDNTGFARAVLTDGTLLSFQFMTSTCNDGHYTINGTSLNCAAVYLDVNGFNPPNTMGRDMFQVLITQTGIISTGVQDSQMYSPLYCNPATAQNFNGDGCSGRVIMEGAMNY